MQEHLQTKIYELKQQGLSFQFSNEALMKKDPVILLNHSHLCSNLKMEKIRWLLRE